MNKLTAAAGFQTLKTCTNTWGQIKKKLMAQAAANGVEVDLMSKTAKSPKKRRNAPDDDSNDALAAVAPKAESKSEPESEGKPEPKPKKARKTTVKKEKPVKEEIDDEDAAIVGAD
ncbi:hypothetical protein ANO11243_047380 [Dothideomycetidae sp. 11243]|nr:hypothetical protein ANO11243_047380 [fungal sp. No.11243]